MTATEAAGAGAGAEAGAIHTTAGTGSIVLASVDGTSEMSIATATDAQMDD